MPELPEVETVRRHLAERIEGDVIRDVEVRLPRIVRHPALNVFAERLREQGIHRVGRRGKYLLFQLDQVLLVSHLRMEGRYAVANPSEPELPHTHVVFRLASGRELRYADVRQFGTMDAVLKGEPLPKGLAELGPEPFDPALDGAALHERWRGRRAPIKSLLLDQRQIAGLGNIYVDEALFAAGIHPLTPAGAVGAEELGVLLREIRDVLARAIREGGSSVRSFRDGYGRHGGFQIQLAVYGRAGEPCPRCGGAIQKIKVAGRGTHVCPACQPISVAAPIGTGVNA
ncbi:bifunctional DNA-formamidopyrimidine glycosylase/DNA-(apurinic or apyrimidinic site) lyase [Alicyclobacillus acidocaldarius]|uniref:Formamidopyrimidine-DNA glycosylase n=1 Tax=Alicyclobacillus acidocaldarius subsp. acidocaldarius (strain ATCC 27009 / DSM 446 / BCRC 14685 / JCM 5260 / KCTC 1825 / NBRC 15652 / NCIMB 11725 / NRRL B-14509 / 104-IA) TaxID=521098 RepID=C8WRU0_ALIAD|nr:bifunctional DNA-formamidopyrimidine glycosylase/DNA-(apurinic or apyrimidinic site) lyase [Alicyclobacillus acidocaldarius]ACV59351.1 formamidopyrimidine-DNA glycosylase [Alicyclobacillus acidocaldarius subsp. acidocaldarius DSM 446]